VGAAEEGSHRRSGGAIFGCVTRRRLCIGSRVLRARSTLAEAFNEVVASRWGIGAPAGNAGGGGSLV
jgi:hypothetical protein